MSFSLCGHWPLLLRLVAFAVLLAVGVSSDAAGQAAPAGQPVTAAEAAELERLLGVPFSEIAGLGLSAEVLRSLLGRLAEETAVGTRGRPRPPSDSAAPVALIGSAALSRAAAGGDLADAFRTLSTAVSASPPVGGGSPVRSIRLRGFSSGHAVVLVDGVRRHRSAVVDSVGDPSDFGAQGPDVAGIPRVAVRQAELFLGGASAQYGTDAVAGVLGFVLKDAREGGVLEIRSGLHGRANAGAPGGPGIEPLVPQAGSMSPAYSVAGNAGLPLGASGFANLSFEHGSRAPTNRAVQRADAADLLEAGNASVRDTAQVWGSPAVADDIKLLGNFGGPLTGGLRWHARTGYSSREVVGGLGFRSPHAAPGVFAGPLVGGVETLLVGHREPGVSCPVIAVLDGVADQAALAAVARHPDCFSFGAVFPGGLAPVITARVGDVSAVGGFRGVFADGRGDWDAWVAYGSSEVDLSVAGSVNPSLGMVAGDDGLDRVEPSSFRPGAVRQTEGSAGFRALWAPVDFVDLAVGVETRAERFGVRAGGPSSWAAGQYSSQGFSVGAIGFPGYRPAEEGVSRVLGGASYLEIGLADPGPADRWRVSSASRIDRYGRFGTLVSQNLRGRWVVREEGASSAAVRGSVSTGFRVPTPAQLSVSGSAPGYDLPGGRFVHRSAAAPVLAEGSLRAGGRPLDPETSISGSIGVGLDTRSFVVGVDHYRVTVRDRFELLGLTVRNTSDLFASPLSSPAFFVNAYATSTTGVDLAAAFRPGGPAGADRIEVAYTRASTTVTDVEAALVSEDRITAIERALPRDRWRIAWVRTAPRLDLFFSASWFGAYWDARDAASSASRLEYLPYSGRLVVDVEAGFPTAAGVRLIAGVRNLFGTVPEENRHPGLVGNLYGRFSPFGFNGAFLYTGLDIQWGPR